MRGMIRGPGSCDYYPTLNVGGADGAGVYMLHLVRSLIRKAGVNKEWKIRFFH